MIKSEIYSLTRKQYFAQDIIKRLEGALSVLDKTENPLVWRDSGIGIQVSDVIADAIVAIRRLRKEIP